MNSRKRILVAVIVLLVGTWTVRRINVLDRRVFFAPSASGVMGLILYILGDLEGSANAYLTDYQNSAKYFTNDGNPQARLSDVNLSQAKAVTEKSDQHRKSAVRILLDRIETELDRDANDSVLDLSAKLLELEPDQYDALLLSSVAHSQKREYGKAIETLNRALRHDKIQSRRTSFYRVLKVTGQLARLGETKRPTCLLAHYFRYLRIFDPRQTATGISYAKRAIETRDRTDDAYLTLGILQSKQWDNGTALDSFLKAIEANPNNADAHRWAAISYEKMGDLANEYKYTQKAYDVAPSDPFYAWPLYSVLTQKMGDYKKALVFNQALLAKNPNDSESHVRLADTYQLLNEYESSVEHFRIALRLDPSNFFAHAGLGRVLRDMGRYPESIAAFQQALSIDPQHPDGHTGLASAFWRQRRYPEAIAEYENAFRLGETDVSHLSSLCWMYHQNSQYNKASACYREVLSISPNDYSAARLLEESNSNIELAKKGNR